VQVLRHQGRTGILRLQSIGCVCRDKAGGNDRESGRRTREKEKRGHGYETSCRRLILYISFWFRSLSR